jgi:hypothetical protein
MNFITKRTFNFLTTVMLALACSSIASAAPANYTPFGDASIVQPGNGSTNAAQLRSDASTTPPYGGINFNIPEGLIVADLDVLSTDYNFTAGSCGGGSTRFSVKVSTIDGPRNIFFYIGDAPNWTNCATNVWVGGINLADPSNIVDNSQVASGQQGVTYGSVQNNFGTLEVISISLVTDGSWMFGTQTMLADNVRINSDRFTFESANSCKNGGWQNFTSAPGPFTNQGQCVSYYAKGGQ